MWAAKVTGWELCLSEGQVLERFSIAHNQKGFEHFFRRVELHRQRLERPVEVAMEGYNGWGPALGISRFSNGATGC